MTAVMAGVDSGAFLCLGRIADVAAGAGMPLDLHALTVEPTKPRLCLNCRSSNLATAPGSTTLEGLACIRRAVSGAPRLGAVVDEKSGYFNTVYSTESSLYMGFRLFGFVFVHRALAMGHSSSARLHQRQGMLLVSYFRRLGGECFLW